MNPRISRLPGGNGDYGKRALELAHEAGLTLDAHQGFVLEEGLRVRDGGQWSAFEFGDCEPRQNGKGGTIEARLIAAVDVVGSLLSIYSAHNFSTSMEHFYRLENVISETPRLHKQLKGGSRGIRRSHGEEGFEFTGGRRIRFRTRTKGGGRGFACDGVLVMDEAMIISEMMFGALFPILSAKTTEIPGPQIWYAGSAVDQLIHEHGVVFARLRERAMEGKGDRLGYVEWSVDPGQGDKGKELGPEDVPLEVLEDRAAWAQANPALGLRISLDYIEEVEFNAMAPRTFAVERLGIGDWPRTDHQPDNPISIEAWDALLDEGSVLQNPPCFAIDVSPDRRTSIAAAGLNQHGQLHVEIADERKGTNWVPERVADLVSAHRPAAVVLDGYGPAASLVAALENMDVEVTTVTAGEHAQACSRLVDMVEAKEVRHLGSPLIDGALRGAQTRPLGDSWAWSRRNSSINIAPLVAATLALSAAMNTQTDEGPMIVLPREPVS